VIVRDVSIPSILAMVTIQSAALGPVNSPGGAPLSRGHSYATNALGMSRFALYQVLERNRQRPIARSKLAEQIAVQIIHLRANENSDPIPVAPDAAVANDGEDLPGVRIENDVLGEDEILDHASCPEGDGLTGQGLSFRYHYTATLENPLLTRKFQARAVVMQRTC
jgi:hypothetical protein